MKIFKKLILFLIIILNICISFARGWTNEDGQWKYINEDGSFAVNKIIPSGDTKYYIDKNGVLVNNYLYKDEKNNIYYFDEKSAMCTNLEIEINKNVKSNFNIEFDATYHFDQRGVADYYVNKSNNEIVVLIDTWLKNENGKWYFKTSDGEIKKDSLLKTGQNIYYVDKNGIRVENYLLNKSNGKTYYFNDDGEMVKDAYVLVNKSTISNEKVDDIYLLEFDYSGNLKSRTKCSNHSIINRIVSYDARIEKYDEDIVFKDEETYSLSSLKEKFKNVKVSDKIKFGKYEQDNKKNGEELISWIVVDENDESITLVSEYILDCINYSQMYSDHLPKFFSTEMRGFLNGEFLYKAFTNDEIRMMKAIESSYVHLLTKEQYIKYFGKSDIDGTNKNSISKGTEYAIAQGLSVSTKETWYNGCGSYWLETYNGNKVMWSGMYGHLYENGQDSILKKGDGVRPVIVIKK